ncbi:hypothetical protein GSI_12373 [Ganoderma sinense ZZ0214-1]|uniref:Reverse transcriptase domain-containing protein n=1 Tax=Ganoderma sinense ZZ0214-1 TaxID=1077348 RepID=A0A2G8RVM1_9APHY|nr:hypothetical protein GSI_12373 [Ganoderma sinense ZZ0214-1]
MHGPFTAPPLTPFRSSPLGVVSRPRNPAKLRVINHLSWPQGSSVNDGIPDSESSIIYEPFDSAVAEIRRLGRGTLLAKLDLKDAFRHIPVRQADWHLLGCTWAGQLYYSVVLVFGIKSAPYIFNLFAEGLHWIIQRHIPASLRHYLDDYLPIFPPATALPRANAAVKWIMALGEELGLEFQGVKTIFPTLCLDFLGLDLDTDAMEARLPADKLTWLGELLSDWASRHTCRLRELQALIGFLQFTAQVVPHARAFIRRLIEFASTFKSDFVIRHIPQYARADIHWWRVFHAHWNGIQLITPSRPTVHIYTDASGSERKGIGGVFASAWFASRVPRRFRKRDIQFKELYAVVQAVLRWGLQWAGCHVVFHIDNQVIVEAIEADLHAPVPARPAPAAHVLSTDPPPQWYETNSFVSRQAAFYLWHGLASSTRRTYSTGQTSFLNFVSLNPAYRNADRNILPASQRAIMEWVASLGARGLKSQTIKAYLSSVRSLHVDCDLPFTACEAPIVQRLIRGIKRYNGERPRNPKMPITLHILQKLCYALSESRSAIDHTMKAAMALAFAGFLRCGEFTLAPGARFNPAVNLTRSSVKFVPDMDNADHIILTLPASKTDPFCKGVSIVMAAAPGSITCPVAAIRAILKGIPGDANSPLFEGLAVESALTRDLFITRLKALLTVHGFNSAQYSGHSFRRGAASSAAAAGYADFEIQLLGRWRSDAYKLYIDVPRERILHLSHRLHWVATEPHA